MMNSQPTAAGNSLVESEIDVPRSEWETSPITLANLRRVIRFLDKADRIYRKHKADIPDPQKEAVPTEVENDDEKLIVEDCPGVSNIKTGLANLGEETFGTPATELAGGTRRLNDNSFVKSEVPLLAFGLSGDHFSVVAQLCVPTGELEIEVYLRTFDAYNFSETVWTDFPLMEWAGTDEDQIVDTVIQHIRTDLDIRDCNKPVQDGLIYLCFPNKRQDILRDYDGKDDLLDPAVRSGIKFLLIDP